MEPHSDMARQFGKKVACFQGAARLKVPTSNAPCAPRFSCLSVRPGLSIAALCVTFTRDADLRLRIQQAA
eukprot:m.177989 g.177989  ORF g.177989 m.177989 type:complete len:70 (-) comp14919_c0_seq2:328-537(-)